MMVLVVNGREGLLREGSLCKGYMAVPIIGGPCLRVLMRRALLFWVYITALALIFWNLPYTRPIIGWLEVFYARTRTEVQGP